MLKQVTVSPKVDEFLFQLKSLIENIPSTEPLVWEKAVDYVAPVVIPCQPGQVQYTFSFEPPTKVAVVGSFLLKTLAKRPAGLNVDIAVQMPNVFLIDLEFVSRKGLHEPSLSP